MGKAIIHFVNGVGSLITSLVAVAVIIIVTVKLENVKLSVATVDNVPQPDVQYTCLLGSDWKNHSICRWAYVVSAGTLIVASVLSLIRCVTCNLFGCGVFLDTAFSGAGTALWVCASAVICREVDEANHQNLPQADWRKSVVILTYVATVTFGLMFIVSLWDLLTRVFGCLCCGEDRKGYRRGDVERGYIKG